MTVRGSLSDNPGRHVCEWGIYVAGDQWVWAVTERLRESGHRAQDTVGGAIGV
jgi:hypothetical protein